MIKNNLYYLGDHWELRGNHAGKQTNSSAVNQVLFWRFNGKKYAPTLKVSDQFSLTLS